MRRTLQLLSVLFAMLTFAPNTNAEDVFDLVCPPDVYLDCHAELWDLNLYGTAYIDKHGQHIPAGQPTVHYYLNNCGTGYITRTWSVEDPYWNWLSCTQTIHVGGGSGQFGYHDITWPDNQTLTGCYPDVSPHVTGFPTWNNYDCTLIGYSYRDQVFKFNDECKKIIRHWTLIDWCRTGHYGQSNDFTYKQIIKIENRKAPELDCIPDLTVSAKNCKNAVVDVDPLTIAGTECGGEFKITNDSKYAYSNNGGDISGVYPIGWHTVKIKVRYGCGYHASCTVKIKVDKLTPPVPICKYQLAIALHGSDTDGDGVNDEGHAEIWAQDFDEKSYSPCGIDPLRFSFSEDPTDNVRHFTCDEVGLNVIKMYVTDAHGSQSYCEANLSVQNNSANIEDCEPPLPEPGHRVQGSVMNIDGEGVMGDDVVIKSTTPTEFIVTNIDTLVVITLDSFVNASGALLFYEKTDSVFSVELDTIYGPSETYSTLTDENGYYLFDTSFVMADQSIMGVSHKDNTIQGVDRADIDALTSHLIGEKLFDKTYQYLAADVNQDGMLTIEDLNILIEYVSEEITTFTETNHRVIVMDSSTMEMKYDILDPAYSVVHFDSLVDQNLNVDFLVVQLGDIVKSASSIVGNDIETSNRSNELSYVLSPNPLHDDFTITFEGMKQGEVSLKVYDLQGKIAYERAWTLSSGSAMIKENLGFLNTGVYLYQLVIDGEQFDGKMLKF